MIEADWTAHCHKCGTKLEKNQFSRSDRCPGCESDTRCCRNCEFDDPSYGTQCRETHAEPVGDRERANFCDYFSPRRAENAPKTGTKPKPSNKSAFDDLFKKKD
jgi:hypothetical protein